MKLDIWGDLPAFQLGFFSFFRDLQWEKVGNFFLAFFFSFLQLHM